MQLLLEKLLAVRQRSYLVVNRDLLIVMASEGVERFSEQPEEVVEGKDVRGGFPELVGCEEILRAILTGQRQSFELSAINKLSIQGKDIYVDLYVVADQYSGLESERCLFFILEDVTKKMVFQRQLMQRENENQLLIGELTNAKDYIDKIVNSMADALLVTTASGIIKTVNPGARELFGYGEAELINQSIALITGTEITQQLQKTVITGQNEQQIEVSCQTKAGKEIAVSFSYSLVPIDLQEQGFVFIGRDITARRRYEEKITQLNSELTQRVEDRTIVLRKTIERLQQEMRERQQAEEELRTSERKFRAIFDQTFQFIGLLQPNGTVLEANQTALDFAGVNQEDVVGKFLWDACWWVMANQTKQKLERAVSLAAQGQFVRDEIELMGANNQVATIDFSLKPVRNEVGQVILLIPEGRDISERKLAEQELKRQNMRSQLLAEVTLNIRQSLDLAAILQTTVTEVQQLLQADRVLIIEQSSPTQGVVVKEAVLANFPVMQGQSVSDHCFELEQLSEYCQNGVSVIGDIHQAAINPACRATLQQFAVQARLGVPILVQKERWGLLVAHKCETPWQWTRFEIELLQQLADQIGIAISQAQLLNNLEEMVSARTTQLTQANLKLQRSEEQLRLIADNLPVLIAYVDAQQRYRFNNQAYQDWFGKSPEQAQGCPLAEVMGEIFYHQYQEHLEAVLSGLRVTFEGELLCADGKFRDFSAVYVPHLDGNRQVLGFFTVMIDISDRKVVERMKDEFVSVASHELRTPLTSIRGSLGLLNTGQLGALSPKGQRLLAIAVNNTDRLSRLINDILDLERIKSGKVNMAIQKCDALKLAEQAAEVMQSMAERSEVTIQVLVGSAQEQLSPQTHAPIPLWADPDHILQTLTNLLSNGIKFSPSGSTVSLSVQASKAEICFQVQDRGRGIPENKRETIFERFQQVDTSDAREKGGTGLGLAICREIVQRHGGHIWVESSPGEGSTFSFTLPRSNQHQER